MSGKDLALLGLFLVAGHFLHRALVYWRYRKVEAPLEAGAFAEEALRRYLTGFRVRVGRRNGVRFGEREVRLTEAVMRGRSLYHLAVAAHEVGHALQWRTREELVRNTQAALTLGFGLLVLGFLLGPTELSALLVFGGYGFVLLSLPLELDANRRGLEALPPEVREGVKRVMTALTASYLVVPLGGMLMVAGWLMGRS